MNKDDIDTLADIVARMRMRVLRDPDEAADAICETFPKVTEASKAYAHTVLYPEFYQELSDALMSQEVRTLGAERHWVMYKPTTSYGVTAQTKQNQISSDDEHIRTAFEIYCDENIETLTELLPFEENISGMLSSPSWAQAVSSVSEDYGVDLLYLIVSDRQ